MKNKGSLFFRYFILYVLLIIVTQFVRSYIDGEKFAFSWRLTAGYFVIAIIAGILSANFLKKG